MQINSQNFVAAINQICDEKKINPESVINAVKDALKAAYRKDFGNRDQNLEVLLDEKSGRTTILLVKKIVEEVENQQAEISLKDAQQIKKGLKVGAKIKIDVTPIDYGRIASQAAKQVIIQKIQEAERIAIYEEYRDRSDELLNALVHRVEGRFVHLELDRTTTVLEPKDQIPRERYQAGQRIKVYLEKVEMTPRGSMLKVSRTHPRLIFRLMELEIPEVRNGAVVVKAIAREPGVRCKLVVDSTDENVDPVGACVGQKGVRIQNITDEVNGERIDVIEYSDDFETLLRETLSPAKLDHILKYEKEKRVEVYVEEDQRALAIGKNGQNVRLASEIMGWEIDVLNTGELEEQGTGDGEPFDSAQGKQGTEEKSKKTQKDGSKKDSEEKGKDKKKKDEKGDKDEKDDEDEKGDKVNKVNKDDDKKDGKKGKKELRIKDKGLSKKDEEDKKDEKKEEEPQEEKAEDEKKEAETKEDSKPEEEVEEKPAKKKEEEELPVTSSQLPEEGSKGPQPKDSKT
ncbi:MAG: transcription termination factor NusA [Patescibacteria group bacterium]